MAYMAYMNEYHGIDSACRLPNICTASVRARPAQLYNKPPAQDNRQLVNWSSNSALSRTDHLPRSCQLNGRLACTADHLTSLDMSQVSLLTMTRSNSCILLIDGEASRTGYLQQDGIIVTGYFRLYNSNILQVWIYRCMVKKMSQLFCSTMPPGIAGYMVAAPDGW